MILTRESQAVRESSPDLSRALHLPGLDAPRRLARGTLPPVEASGTRPVPPSVVAQAEQATEVRLAARVKVAIGAVVVSAGVVGYLAAIVAS